MGDAAQPVRSGENGAMVGSAETRPVQVELGTEARVFVDEQLETRPRSHFLYHPRPVSRLPAHVAGAVFALVPQGMPMEHLSNPNWSMWGPVTSCQRCTSCAMASWQPKEWSDAREAVDRVNRTLAETLHRQYGESREHSYVFQDYFWSGDDGDLGWSVSRTEYEGRHAGHSVTHSYLTYVGRCSDVSVDSLASMMQVLHWYGNVGAVVESRGASVPPFGDPVVVMTQMFDAETLGWWEAFPARTGVQHHA